MKEPGPKIVVAGDITIDWLQWTVPAKDSGGEGPDCARNWQLYEGTRMVARPGGALLLARLIEQAGVATVAAPELPDIESVPPNDVLHSNVHLGMFPATSAKQDRGNLVRRIDRMFGYSGPESGATAPLPVKDDDPNADIVVLDDAGNSIRDKRNAWPKAIAQGKTPIVIIKMSRRVAAGGLWKHLLSEHADRLVVVVDADDLRCEAVNISRRLSWEHTAKDFVWQLAGNLDLVPFAGCRNLVVRFDMDGAIHCTQQAGRTQARLYYDPARIEGGFAAEHPGTMMGLSAAFLAGLATRVAVSGLDGVGEGVRDGILCSRRLHAAGFGRDGQEPDYPIRGVFKTPTHGLNGEVSGAPAYEPKIDDIAIPAASSMLAADPDFWTILEEVTAPNLEAVALNYVEFGTDSLLDKVPIARFGKLKTVDRTEIEGYHSLQNLIREYVSARSVKRPLCIGVFGPPGAGKTFAVTQITESVAAGVVRGMDFNLSQWESPRDLVEALHQVRDVVLEGHVPLVFFDEFDSNFQGVDLGWLKYFLDPMQSGKFKDGATTHPVGKAIFVFAGATSSTLAEFSRLGGRKEEIEGFRAVKGPDFVSRLRGYVNVLGVNPADPGDPAVSGDRLYMIRRAVALRAQLEMNAKHLADHSGRIRIDPGVLRALVKIPEYRHGMRSMEALIDMSMLADRRIFEQSALPPAAQLDLHVDAGVFALLVGGAREAIARAAHEAFVADNLKTKAKPPTDPGMQPWSDLAEFYKESNRQQADQFPVYLKAVGRAFHTVPGRQAHVVELTTAEVETLARMEHERWLAEKLADGWVYGRKRDEVKKTHPCIVSWEKLPEKEREKDRQAVRAIPRILGDGGYETYPLGE